MIGTIDTTVYLTSATALLAEGYTKTSQQLVGDTPVHWWSKPNTGLDLPLQLIGGLYKIHTGLLDVLMPPWIWVADGDCIAEYWDGVSIEYQTKVAA